MRELHVEGLEGTDIPEDGGALDAESASEPEGLNRSEDAELRQLGWFAKAGQLSERSNSRLSQLRAKDRRETIRDPRPDPTSGSTPGAPRFGSTAAEPFVCPNCGFGIVRLSGQSSSCPNCGCSVRRETAGSDPFGVGGTPVSNDAELPALGSLDQEAFRTLLPNAARGHEPASP
jgi:hypothetical protein